MLGVVLQASVFLGPGSAAIAAVVAEEVAGCSAFPGALRVCRARCAGRGLRSVRCAGFALVLQTTRTFCKIVLN